ncbi:MAG: glycosyltransferase family 9 protein, partial [Acetobacteraceae bacterium]
PKARGAHSRDSRLMHGRCPRLAIINGFGMTLGDGIIGLTALSAALSAGVLGRRRPLLVRKPLFGRGLVNALYRAAAPFADVTWLPYRARARAPFETRVSMREFAFDPAFRGVAMIDFFLRRLGADPSAIAAAQKRNRWLARAITPRPPPGLPQRYVLVCPRASIPLRTMPEAVHACILADLLTLQELPVVTQGRPAAHARLIYCPACRSLAELAGLVREAALIVSTDTAMLHLADAWSVPTLAFFVTHDPEWRVRDYPFCTAVRLPARLPPALEFPRDDRDLARAAAAWRAPGRDLGWLAPLLTAALRGTEGEPA